MLASDKKSGIGLIEENGISVAKHLGHLGFVGPKVPCCMSLWLYVEIQHVCGSVVQSLGRKPSGLTTTMPHLCQNASLGTGRIQLNVLTGKHSRSKETLMAVNQIIMGEFARKKCKNYAQKANN